VGANRSSGQARNTFLAYLESKVELAFEAAKKAAGSAVNAFVQGGNAFGASGVLGTNDNNDLNVRTNGVNRFRFPAGLGLLRFLQSSAPAQAGDINVDPVTGLISLFVKGGVVTLPGGPSGSGLPAALAQATWHINASTGNDANNGLTAGTALKTCAELENRLGHYGNITAASVTINLDSNIPSSDPLNLLVVLPPDGSLTVQGTAATTLHTGSFTAATTALNRATNQAWQVTDAAIGGASWTPFIGQRLRITAGARAGDEMWVAKNISAGVARVSQLVVPTNPPTEATPTNGDAYVIESLTQVAIGNIDVRAQTGASTAIFPTLFLNDLHIVDPGAADLAATGFAMVATSCLIDPLVVTSFFDAVFVNCCLTSGDVAPGQLGGFGGGVTFYSGLWLNITSAVFNSQVYVDFDLLAQGCSINVNGTLSVGAAGFFDSAGDALVVGSPNNTFSRGYLQVVAASGGPGAFLYGSGNTGFGVHIASDSTLAYTTGSIPTVTGTSGDFTLAAGSAHGFNDATEVYTATIAQTWAKIGTTIAGGGFGGDAHNLKSNSHVVVLA
jgi:hypothetical protein